MLEKGYTYLLGKSSKIDKSDKNSEYQSFIMYLAPSTQSGVNVCPNASTGCAAACLYTSGKGRFPTVKRARINRTLHYLNNRVEFLRQLRAEVMYHSILNDKIAIRLNGTSDLNWMPFIRKVSPQAQNVVWYDYTKNLNFAIAALSMDNYHVTFSRSETNEKECLKALEMGINVAVVFKSLPTTWKGYTVIDGDKTDTRFLDAKGIVVGLTAKGDAKKDTTGFVVSEKIN